MLTQYQKANTQVSLVVSKKVGLEVNGEKITYVFKFLEQKAQKSQHKDKC